jgi:hypothetical protein
MQYLIKLSDAAGQHMVLLTVSEREANSPAMDIVLDLIGAEDVEQLVKSNILSAGQTDDLKALQQIIFDHDEQGAFIRENITFTANGRDLDPDAFMGAAFVPAERDGIKYMRCDLVVATPNMVPIAQAGAFAAGATSSTGATSPGGAIPAAGSLFAAGGTFSTSTTPTPGAASSAAGGGNADDAMKDFAQIMFLHQIAVGYQLDVTKDLAELADLIPELEKKELIDIDVQKASYKLTPAGKALHDRYIAEAQDLIKRFDVFADADLDSSGTARFDTGLGKDVRVAAYEYAGIDPFRARFLLGINDGEWDQLSNWYQVIFEQSWYQNIFSPVERAPGVDDIGREAMRSIIEQGNAAVRSEQAR